MGWGIGRLASVARIMRLSLNYVLSCRYVRAETVFQKFQKIAYMRCGSVAGSVVLDCRFELRRNSKDKICVTEMESPKSRNKGSLANDPAKTAERSF